MPSTTYHGPINPNPKDDEASIIIYGYVPSLGVAITGIILWSFVLLCQSVYIWRKRGYRTFHILCAVGALMEMGGYAARAYSHGRPFVIGSFVAQYFLIVVAPVLFSAAIYLSLTYAIKGFRGSEKLLLIPAKWILRFFVTVDVVTTIIQIAGAALIGTSESASVRGNKSSVTPEQANDILLAGLALQLFSFCCFLTILSFAIFKFNQKQIVLSELSRTEHKRLHYYLYIILITSDLILLRTTYRLAESAQGFFGTAATSEILYGLLESLPVILALIIWCALPPKRFFQQVEPVSSSTQRVEQSEKKQDQRRRPAAEAGEQETSEAATQPQTLPPSDV